MPAAAAAENEQVKPLTPAAAAHRSITINEDHNSSADLKKHPHRKYIKCCGCVAAALVIHAVVMLILVFTIFHVKDPVMKMNSVKLQGLRQGIDFRNTNVYTNLSISADISIQNPNAASFRFNNATTGISYAGVQIGEVSTPSGNARAGRTFHMNLTVAVMFDKLMKTPGLLGDLGSEKLPVNSYTDLRGRVKILGFIKKSVGIRMNCSMTLNLQSQEIQDQDCKRKVSL